MRKIIIKEWPFPEKTKAMLLRVENPVFAGNGNWYINVIFRSIDKEDRKVKLDWGLLPMLKTGQIFSDGAKLYDKKNSKIAVFTFNNVKFEFFIDRIITEAGTIQRPAFRAKLGEIYYCIPAIEVARSFFARTRRLSYALLETNSIMSLCQCEISTYPIKKVVVHLSPDCPTDLASERWISTLVWMATDTLAQKSWNSFFLYFKLCQGLNVFPKQEEEIPVFPLMGKFSITCSYRGYSKNIWLDEIIKVDCDNIGFDEIVVEKYVTERRNGTKAKVVSVKTSDKVEIINSAQSASNRHVMADIDLPSLLFEKQPRISVIKKSIGMGTGGYCCIENVDESIAVTGKNEGFTDARTGIEFSSFEKDITAVNDEPNMVSILELNEVNPGDLKYNDTLPVYLETIRLLARHWGVAGVGTKIYEFPGETSFAWITANARRCCAVSMVKLSTGKVTYIIEPERSQYGSREKRKVSTLLLNIIVGDHMQTLFNLIRNLAVSGHWGKSMLEDMKTKIAYEKVKHGNEENKAWWAGRIWDAMFRLS